MTDAAACGKRVAHTNRERDEKAQRMIYSYRPLILDELARHGLMPKPETPPGVLRDAVRDLYRYEIRRLRQALLARMIEKRTGTELTEKG
jgi:hypothetical protein